MNNKSLPPKPEKLLSSHLEKKAPLPPTPPPPPASPPPTNPSIASVGLSPQPSKKISFNKKTWLIILLALFALAGIVGAVYLAQQRTEIEPKAACPGEGTSCQGLTGTHCNTSSCCVHTCQSDGNWGSGTYCGDECKNHPDCQSTCNGGGGGGGGGTPACGSGGVCSPNGCLEAYCSTTGGTETECCHLCSNNEWANNSGCGSHNTCHDHNNPNDNTAYSVSGCTSSGSDHCPNGTCEDYENCDPTSDDYCPADCDCPVATPTGTNCPYDVTPYVIQTGSLHSGYANCNGDAWCIELRLPEQYASCTYLAEAYTDLPQTCGPQQTHLKVRNTISNGGKICFGDFNWGSDCKAQLDIRYNQPGAKAGNLQTYKIVCGVISTPTPTPIPPTSTPTPTPTITPTPIPYSCQCSTITLYSQNWTEIEPTDIIAGQTIHIAVSGRSGYPEYEFDKGRIRVNKTAWDNSDETTQGVSGHPGQFYITYLVPADGGTFRVEGEIHLNATITDPEDTGWWR